VGRGEFAYFQSSIAIIFAVSALGVRHASYRARQTGASRFDNSNRALLIFAFVVSTAAGIVLAVLAGHGLNIWIAILVLAAGLFGPIYALTQMEVANAQLGRYRRRVAVLSGAPAVVEFVLNLALVFIRQLGIATAIAATVLAETVRNAAALQWRFGDRRRIGLPGMGLQPGAPLLRSSLIAAPAVLVPMLASNLDSIIYGSLLGAKALGMYAVAKLGYTLFLLVAVTAEGYVVTRLAHRSPLRSLLLLLAFAAPFGAAIGVVGFAAFPFFFGTPFEEARVAFPSAVAAGIVGTVFISLLAIAAFNGRQRASFVAALGSLLALALGALVVSMIGMATATEMCYALLAAQVVGVLMIVFRMSPRETRNQDG
jgi:O-antigen/teichoic acid export membrane protein